MKSRMLIVLTVVALVTLIVGCAPPTPERVVEEKVVEKPVIQTVVVEKEKVVEKPVIQTVVVEKEVPVEKEVIKEVVITPTPQTGVLAEITPEQRAWLEAAQLGPFAPATEDWDAVYEAAKKEGKVVVYSSSSRIFDIAETFQAAYPGITVEGYDITAPDLILKVKAEQNAGIHNADVIFVGDPPTVIPELVKRHLVWNFVPPELVDVIPEDWREPVLMHHFGMKVICYNSEIYDKAPVDNWWDLTREEWKGRVIFKDPFESGEIFNLFSMMVKNADIMAQAYEEEFGKPIELDEDCPTAGHQWIKDLIENEVVLTASDGDASEAVGTKGQTEAPIGFFAYSKYRDVLKGKLAFEAALDAKPMAGVATGTTLSIANLAPHPNAAKLMVLWYMGDEEGGKGFEPYHVPGDLPTRTDMALPEGMFGIDVAREVLWDLDYDWCYLNLPDIRDFWTIHLQE